MKSETPQAVGLNLAHAGYHPYDGPNTPIVLAAQKTTHRASEAKIYNFNNYTNHYYNCWGTTAVTLH